MSFATAASGKSVWGFSPQSIPGLTWWLDGADATSMTFSSGSNITQWRDKSGNGFHATGVNSPQKISTGGVSFVASSSNYFTMNVSYSPTQTMFMVSSPVPSTSSSQYYINTNPVNKGGIFLGGYNSSFISYYNNTITNFESGTTTTPFVVSLVKLAGVTSVGNYNGSQAFSIAANTADSATSTWAILGGAASNANLLTANIYEFIIFNVALPTTQIQQVEGYLAAKWGLGMNLPATHPYSSVVPFLPTQISGCQLWLDAADSSTITGTSPVTAWADKSGNGNHATTISAGSTISNINGVPAIVPYYGFTGTTTNRTPTLTCFAVAVFNAPTFGRAVALGGPGYNDYNTISGCALFTKIGDSNAIYCTRYISNTPSLDVASNAVFLASTVFDNTSNTLYVNGGSSQGAVASSFGNFGYTNYGVGYSLQSPLSTTPAWTGPIGEVILYNAALSTSQRNQVEQYLGQKWKISVANAPSPGRYLIPTNRPFYPTDIGGCQLWLDAADRSSMTFSSGSLTNISGWNDKSGNGNNGTANTGITWDSNGLGTGLPAMTFTNTQWFTGNVNLSGTSQLTSFCIYNMNASSKTNARVLSLAAPGKSDAGSNLFMCVLRYSGGQCQMIVTVHLQQ